MATATSSELIVSPARCCWCQAALVRRADSPWVCPTPACQRRQLEYAVSMAQTTRGGRAKESTRRYWYIPTPKQVMYHATKRDPAARGTKVHRLYGGAAGPGKSKAGREDIFSHAWQIEGFKGCILRRTLPELQKTHLKQFPIYASAFDLTYLKSEHLLQFPRNSTVEVGHCQDDEAVERWLSSEWDQMVLDEGSTFEPDMLLELSTRVRSTNEQVKQLGGPWFDVLTNPGGPSWATIRDFFIDHTPDFEDRPQLRDKYDPRGWIYIKATLDDNPYLDEQYEADLAVLSEARYRQLRYGDEYVADGQFFSQWRETKEGQPWHVRDLEVSVECEHFVSMDWGYSAPGVALWWACLPDGHYHIRHEYKFRETSAEDVAQEIMRQTAGLGIKRLRYVVCDPAMKQKTGAGRGEAIFETLARYGLPMRAGDNDRYNGWQRCRELLRPAPDGQPWLTVDSACGYGRRTIPAQVQDPKDPEDLDSSKDDHWVDAWRYGAMSRPTPSRARRAVEDGADIPNSWGWWRNFHRRQEQPRGVLA